MADLSSILGGMVQGFKDFGTGLVDMFGTGGAAIGDAIESIRTGRATNRNQDDFRKWLYQTDNTQDAAAKGLGTILNGVQTVADVIPGAQAVTANPLFNGLQGAVAGVSDELKMAGKDADWGKAAQRAGVGGASGLLSAAAGQNLQKSGSKLLSNGLTRGAVQGAIGGGIANAGYTGIEGGSVQDMINAGLYGAQTGALVGGTTGLARELIKPTHKMDVAFTDEEKAARIKNAQDQIDDLKWQIMNASPDDTDFDLRAANNRIAELRGIINKYQTPEPTVKTKTVADLMSPQDNRKAQFDLLQKTNPMTDDYHTGIRSPEDIYTLKNIVDAYNADDNFTYPDFTLSDAQKALANGNIDVYSSKPIEAGAFISPSKMMAADYAGDGQVYSKNIPLDDFAFIESGDEGNYLPVSKKPANVADLMLSPEQEEFFKGSVMRDENGKLMRVYHSSPNKFTTFDDSKLGENTAYTNTAFGHFVTPDADFSSRFMDIDNKGTKGNMMELYANVKKPITHPYNADYKYKGADLDNIVENYFKATDDLEDLNFLKQAAKDNGTSLYEAYVDNMDIDSDPFEAAQWDREALMKKGYDAVEMVEGLKSGLVDGSADNTPVSSYAIFSGNQLKDVNNLRPTADADIMYSKVAEGQLGLFDQPMPKPEPEPVTLPKSLGEQASLFDQPKQPIVEAQVVDTEPINPYAPVDGQVTQKMRDRAADVIKNYAKGVPENELFNAIDESTLPKGYKEFRELVDNSKSFAKERIGAESVKKADLKKVVEYLYPDTAKQEEMLRNVKIEESNDAARRAMYGLKPRKSGTGFNEKILRNAASEKLAKEYAEKMRLVDDRAPELVNSLERWYSPTDLSVRTGLTAAADEVLSERLGIAPGNTIKYNGPADVRNAYGRYSKTAKNLALTKSNVADPEQAVSTMAHERLHSFQNEADLNRGKYGATNRYDKRVTDAFDDLRKDLEEAKVYKSYPETAERYGSKDAEYFYNTKEQEARMLQQYLNNKGYADLAELKRPNTGKSRSGEFGTEVNAAFDKFFDKLRALSKKGVALPAITALLGGGAIAGALTSGKDDKKKKSEVK